MTIAFGDAILNFYKHDECESHWADLWDCGCNDECPNCGAEIEPYASLEVRDIEMRFRTRERRRRPRSAKISPSQ
jgi:hypothetical protein